MLLQAGERNGDDLAVLRRSNRTGARAAVEQRHLADGLACGQQGEAMADVAALLALQNLEAAGEDEEEGVAGIAFLEQKLSLRNFAGAVDDGGQLPDILVREAFQKRRAPQALVDSQMPRIRRRATKTFHFIPLARKAPAP